MFSLLCGGVSEGTCSVYKYVSIFILAWQLAVGVLLILGLNSIIFLAIEIGFLLGAGVYADEMNFQMLNVALLCIVFRFGMPIWLAAVCFSHTHPRRLHLEQNLQFSGALCGVTSISGTGIIAALLICHIAWIANHMRWIANDQINPWKLGGYAMYTVPDLAARLVVVDPAFSEAPVRVSLTRYLAAQRFINPGRVFRCAHMTAEAIRALIYENRHLIGRNIALIITESRFVHDPPSLKRGMQGRVLLTWHDMKTFTFVSNFCGSEHTETTTWDE